MKNRLPSRAVAVPQALLSLFVYVLSASAACANLALIPAGSSWRYLDNGSNQGTAWRAPSFNDSAWAAGAAELGYGDADEATIVSYGPSTTNRYITTYFRQTFTVPDPAAFTSVKLRLLRDDGAVVYLNGAEVRRDNMPAGTVSSTTLAASSLGVPAEATYFEATLPTTALIAGTNTIAVEIHQGAVNSSDISFNLELIGVDTVSITRGPYLQKGTPTSVVVRWRTDTATASRVSFGTAPDVFETAIVDSTVTTEHQVELTGLVPDTQYYYAVGSPTATHGSGPDYIFYTAPPVGTAQPTRVWVLGDSGTATAAVGQMRDAYTTFTGSRYTDLWLMLGDNAYNSGTDAEYQAAVFNIFPTMLRQSVLWSTIGNHDTASSINPPLTIPYFQIFNLPTNAEAGGLPSGTEKYYSFDFANIHFICLDSMTSIRTATGAMATWLQNDLGSTTQEWIIAFFHHPPYSKGSHNSDIDTESIEMRGSLLPILEAGGADLVLSGHSHSYERSFLLDGHYGLSTTLTAQMKKDAGSGRESSPDATGAYEKPSLNAANQGAVYITAGSSGQATGGTLNHPAMYISFNNMGSLVLDVDGPRLDVKYLRETGAVDDFFTVLKTIPNEPPTVAISSPAEGATFTAPANIPVTATASDSDGQVVQVDFYGNETLLGTRTTAPFTIDWTNVGAGSYALTATATDDKGATVTSTPVNISVMNPPPPPAPTGLAAAAGDAQVTLGWAASPGATSYKVKRSTTAGGPHIVIAAGVAGTSFTDAGVTNGTTYYYVVSAVNAGGEGPESNEASARPLPAPPLPPGALSATAGDAQVTLGWNPSAGATSYAVHRGTLPGGPYTTVAIGLGASGFTDTAVTNGTAYYYVVTAANLGGESGLSNEASATPAPQPPAAPSGAIASAGDAEITLTWTVSAGATSYSVRRGTASGGPYTAVAIGLATNSFQDAPLVNGTTYYYVVTASNSAGESGPSNEASATPAPPPPPAPANLVATGGDAQITLAWEASAAATSYSVKRATVSGGPYALIATGLAGTGYSDAAVVKGTTYFYVVTASNLGGESAASNQASATPAPAAPVGLSATAGNAQVALSWGTSSGATSYTVKRAVVSGGPYGIVASGLTATSYNDTSVSNGTTYFYVVTASNAAGESANSNERSATPTAPPTAPAAPTSLTATTASRTQINLSWADNSTNETGFLIERSTSIGSGFLQIGSVGVNVTTFASTGLKSNKVYYYRVRATNAVGQSAYSNTASAKTLR